MDLLEQFPEVAPGRSPSAREIAANRQVSRVGDAGGPQDFGDRVMPWPGGYLGKFVPDVRSSVWPRFPLARRLGRGAGALPGPQFTSTGPEGGAPVPAELRRRQGDRLHLKMMCSVL